jgi:hypothetical protein
MRPLLAFLVTIGLVLAVAGPGTASPLGLPVVPPADAIVVDMQSDGDTADPCSCGLIGSCSAPWLHPPEGPTAFAGKPPHLVPIGDRIPGGLPPDVPSPPPRSV